mmetsp:Transcript_2863/g.9328  ORF Transcript_2863/g.9328 Transcript_2863/m.9328 type:complete len:223 (-) Transcript_2863:2139-2807(-)
MVNFECSFKCDNNGCKAPCDNTKSLHLVLSPAMFPNAHTACSLTSSLGEDNNCTKMGTAPEFITVAVSSDVPLATFVNAHAASNCNCGKSTLCKNSTNFPTTPVATTSLIGGVRSMERNLRNRVVASSCTAGSGLFTPSTICGRDSNFAFVLCSCVMAVESLASLNTFGLISAPPEAPPTLIRFFAIASSRFSFRMAIIWSSRFRRLSSASADFLKDFLRES